MASLLPNNYKTDLPPFQYLVREQYILLHYQMNLKKKGLFSLFLHQYQEILLFFFFLFLLMPLLFDVNIMEEMSINDQQFFFSGLFLIKMLKNAFFLCYRD